MIENKVSRNTLIAWYRDMLSEKGWKDNDIVKFVKQVEKNNQCNFGVYLENLVNSQEFQSEDKKES